MTRIEAAASADKAAAARLSANGADFAAGEHPDTARHRIQHAFIMQVSSLSREAADRRYAHLMRLIDRAKEELGHARSASNEMRMAAMQQNIDELVAYVAGHGIRAKLPNRHGESASPSMANLYVLDEIPTFLGEIGFLIDLWYEKELEKVHAELLKLTGLAARLA
ncbi:hypothetical protein U4960_15985 [Altererythrobacter sp. H2]|uniref:hypothetical protein n=1 Tax=Altererythrobacter sp. H2 TaxID=3108391 RepID=UPI002B4C090B|nr:hypothetical protein [Altererythrobacter sp. H2]WRK95749.1 hypothetical protein U4960_15985 [Altererythrobacter sp. H2]